MTLLAAREAVTIPARFCGPPESGNGGYTCGLLAKALPQADAVECTIRKPIPLDRKLQVDAAENHAKLLDGEEVVIEAVATDLELSLPDAISWAEAQEAVKRSPAFHNHPFPTCFVCGPERSEHDGLRLFPGLVSDRGGYENMFAAAWVPAKEFADDAGKVREEFVWAAMDCPTGFAAGFPWAGTLVTGRLAVEQTAEVFPQQRYVIMSWPTGNEGRKFHAGAALFNANGELCAKARATWIKLG